MRHNLEKAQAVAAGARGGCPPTRRRPRGGVVILAGGNAHWHSGHRHANPLTAGHMGLILDHSTSTAEEIAQAFPGAEVGRGFNTGLAQVLRREVLANSLALAGSAS